MVGVGLFVTTGDEPVMTGAAGVEVSIENDKAELAELPLPAASVKTPVFADTVPVTPLRPFVGVNVNRYSVEETAVKALIDPSVATTSVLTKFTEGSLSTAVTTAVSPTFSAVVVEENTTVGTT